MASTASASTIWRLGTLLAALLLTGTAAGRELVDPTRPPPSLTAAPTADAGEEEGESVEWRLTATFTTGKRRRAVINGRHVRIGDTIRDAEVLTIRPGRVTLMGGEEKFTLQVVTDSIRRPATGIILPL